MGSCAPDEKCQPLERRGRTAEMERTMSGKKMGNQLSMSPAARSGWMERPTSPYRTASK